MSAAGRGRLASFENLRLVGASALREYFANTEFWRREGNVAFAERVARRPRSLGAPPGLAASKPFVLYHAWMPGFVELSGTDATTVGRILRRRPSVREPRTALEQALVGLGWCRSGPAPIRSIVQRTQDRFVAIQNEYELSRFLRLVRRKRPRVIVEIGSARGGTLYAMCQLAEPTAEVISVDLPGARNCGGQTAVERSVFRSFARPRQRLTFIPRDSHLPTTLRAVRRALGGKAVDLLFIDGDHSRDGVRRGFEDYSPLVAADGLVVFHDVIAHERVWHANFGVGDFWDEIKGRYASLEIIDPAGTRTPTRASGEHPAWGFGVLRPGVPRGRRAPGQGGCTVVRGPISPRGRCSKWAARPT